MRRAAAVLVTVALVVGAIGCGDAPLPPAPPAVPVNLAPASLAPDLGFEEFTDAKKAFAEAGTSSLVADGKLWQIRRAATLIGTLQISTVKRDVSTADVRDRRDILAAVMTGAAYETVDVGGVAVARASRADKTLFVWFGANLFEVLQLKGTKVDPDAVINALLAHQLADGKLTPVGTVDEDEVAP
jgi:hypothetical protein